MMTDEFSIIKYMRTLLVVTGLCLGIMGCCSAKNTYREGTSLQLGAYIPYSENLYGVELMSYVNGVKVNVSSNQAFTCERTHSATNSWGWGLLQNIEYSKTKIEVETKK